MTMHEAEDLLASEQELLSRYPSFAGCAEASVLLVYSNLMVAALKVVEAKNNKGFLIEVCAKLSEGPKAKYVTGSGQSNATTRRVRIYEREGSVTAAPRKRSTSDTDSDSGDSKRSRADAISDESFFSSEEECDLDRFVSPNTGSVDVSTNLFAEKDFYSPESGDLLEMMYWDVDLEFPARIVQQEAAVAVQDKDEEDCESCTDGVVGPDFSFCSKVSCWRCVNVWRIGRSSCETL
jgi:hypothetical protein